MSQGVLSGCTSSARWAPCRSVALLCRLLWRYACLLRLSEICPPRRAAEPCCCARGLGVARVAVRYNAAARRGRVRQYTSRGHVGASGDGKGNAGGDETGVTASVWMIVVPPPPSHDVDGASCARVLRACACASSVDVPRLPLASCLCTAGGWGAGRRGGVGSHRLCHLRAVLRMACRLCGG